MGFEHGQQPSRARGLGFVGEIDDAGVPNGVEVGGAARRAIAQRGDVHVVAAAVVIVDRVEGLMEVADEGGSGISALRRVVQWDFDVSASSARARAISAITQSPFSVGGQSRAAL